MENHNTLANVKFLKSGMFSPDVEIIDVPDSVEDMSAPEIFSMLPNLHSLSFGVSVKKMGPHLFVGSNNLTNIDYRGTMKDFEQTEKDTDWIADSKVWTVTCTDGKLSVGYDYEWKRACEYLATMTDDDLEYPEDVIETYHRNKQVLADVFLEVGVILTPKYKKSTNKFEI